MFSKVLKWFKWIFGVVPKSAIGSPVVFRVVHYTMVAILALIFGIFSNSIMELLHIPQQRHEGFELIDRYWAGFVFLLAYAIVRVVLYLLTILGIEEESEFKDIDRPWEQALADLEDEGILIDDLPLFLVNGLTPQQEQSVFLESSNIEWKVTSPPPNDTGAPLRVFANSDAIFVSCTGIGSVSLQQGKVVDGSPGASLGGGVSPPIGVGNQTQVAGQIGSIMSGARPATGTIVGGLGASPPPASPPPPVATTATGTLRSIGAAFAQATMSPGGVQRAMKSYSGQGAEGKGYGKKQVAPITDLEAELGSLRMDYLCSLIKNARQPYCPINGLLQAIPVTWAASYEEARKLAPAIRYDLECIHESLQLQFPVVVVFSELDSLPGLKEFLKRLERVQRGIRGSRAGSRYWPGAEINMENVDLVIDRAMNWFRGWIYAAFDNDINSSENQSLFHLLCSIRQRKSAMSVLLREGLSHVADPEIRLSGCYFSATGAGATEQGFIRGVLDRLVEMEEEVAWSPELTRSLGKQSFWTNLMIGGTVLLALVNAYVAFQLLQGGQQ